MAEKIKDGIARMVSCSMQAFGLGCLDFFFERARFQFWTDSRIFGFVCFGELGIYMYREMKHASFFPPTTFLARPSPFLVAQCLVVQVLLCAYFLDLTSCSRPLT